MTFEEVFFSFPHALFLAMNPRAIIEIGGTYEPSPVFLGKR